MTDITTGPLSASVRLRTSLRPWHDALEATPFAHALLSGVLPLDRYVGQLTAYREVLGALEEELSRSTCPAVTVVWDDSLGKLPFIEQDLRHFAERGVHMSGAASAAARAFVADIRRTATTAPQELLGFLYVLEGSTMGARYLLRFVRDAFALTAGTDGVAYYASGDRARWVRLTERLDAALSGPEAQNQVLAAAERAYRHTAAVTEALSADLLPHAS